MDNRRKAHGADDRQRVFKSRDLHLEILVVAFVRRGKMRKHALEKQLGRFAEDAQQPRRARRLQRTPGAPCRCRSSNGRARAFSLRQDSGGSPPAGRNAGRVKEMSFMISVSRSVSFDAPSTRIGSFTPFWRSCQRFVDRCDGERVRACADQAARNGKRAVTVGVSLDHGHDMFLRTDKRTNLLKIPADDLGIDVSECLSAMINASFPRKNAIRAKSMRRKQKYVPRIFIRANVARMQSSFLLAVRPRRRTYLTQMIQKRTHRCTSFWKLILKPHYSSH